MKAFRVARGVLCISLAPWMMACGEDIYPESGAEPGEQFPGGHTTVPVLSRANAFIFPVDNITDEHEQKFQTGNRLFNQSWVTAPSSTAGFDGVGPLFNARSCSACHFRDGRGAPPLEEGEAFTGLLLRLSVESSKEQRAAAHGAPLPDANYGGQLQPFSILGVPAEGKPQVSYSEITGSYPDGQAYSLLDPHYSVEDLAYGEFDPKLEMSPRVAPAMIGLGLLEAIPESRLNELADADDADGDGISGRVNRVWDVQKQQVTVGRFGWKSEQPSVRQQSAGAFLGDMGITSTPFPSPECSKSEVDCAASPDGGAPEIEDHDLDRVALYGRLLGVPIRERFDDEVVLSGKQLFNRIGCADCHVPSHETSEHELEELGGVQIWPYTDLLLHDMGERLSDERPSFDAEGAEWRTPPLWGLRFYEVVNGHNRLLHDGRARGVEEAVLWHGGEGEAAREAFTHLSVAARRMLIEFVESL